MDPSRPDGGHALTERAAALGVSVTLAVTLLCSTSATLGAQSTDDYWRDLRSHSDAAIVLASSAPPTVPAEIADGLRLFRAYEVTNDERAARRARDLLRDARIAPEHRAWHALALAMVYARGPDSRMRLRDGEYLTDPNSNASAESLRLLRTALTLRPQFEEAAIELATWALDREHGLVAAEAEIALAALPQDGDVLLTRAALNLLLDQPPLAAELAAKAQLEGADSSLARHTRAWALFQHARSAAEAVQLYYRGAYEMSDRGRREYGRFLAPLLSEDEMDEWRATPNARAGEWLHDYWARNAANAGVLPEERLIEHYRRVHRARVEFPNTAPLSVLHQQAQFALREDGRRFGLSLHGLMLVRHGDPYRLAQIEQCLSNPWPTDGASATICGELGARRTALFQAAARLARGDSYFPFTRGISLYWGVYAFRGAAGTNDVVFAIGLPARSANALVEGSGRVAGLLSTVLLPDSGDYIRRDSAFSMPLPRDADPMAGETDAVTLLFGVLEAPAEDGQQQFRVTVSDPQRHAGGTAAGSVETYAFDGLSLSDIAVAPSEMAALSGWRRGDVTVGFAPLAQYVAGQTIALYYEVYGLPEGATYETEIELEPPAENVGQRVLDLLGRDRSVRFRFDGEADAPHAVYGLQQNRTITLDGVEPGIWTLYVRVTDATSGRTTERETLVEVTE